MFGYDSGFTARVKAVLGPTNTGKTHLAIERPEAELELEAAAERREPEPVGGRA